MRIGISTVQIGSGAGGIETYVRNLVRAFGSVGGDNEYLLYTRNLLPDSLLAHANRMHQVMIPRRSDGTRLPLAFSRAIAASHLDVIHEQSVAPLLFGAPLIITIHDLYHEHYQHRYNRWDLAKTRLRTTTTLHRAAAIIADSVFTKEDIIRYYGIAPQKITVGYLAADPLFHPIHDESRLTAAREQYADGQRFILSVGALKETKNLKTAIDAYVRLRRAGAITHRLLLTGATTPWLHHDIFAQARTSGYGDAITFTGFVPIEELAILYNAADLFVHPSLFEGFGLPPLEAMACGTPVVTSNTTATPEVVGEAALMVDPFDVEALTTAMVGMLNNTKQREQFARLGLERAAAFSWETTARTALDVYGRVAAGQR